MILLKIHSNLMDTFYNLSFTSCVPMVWHTSGATSQYEHGWWLKGSPVEPYREGCVCIGLYSTNSDLVCLSGEHSLSILTLQCLSISGMIWSSIRSREPSLFLRITNTFKQLHKFPSMLLIGWIINCVSLDLNFFKCYLRLLKLTLKFAI